MTHCPQCHHALARVDGLILQGAFKTALPGHPWRSRRPKPKQTFFFCGDCEAQDLHSIAPDATFLANDGVMRTIADTPSSPVLSLSLLRFTTNALHCAIAHGYKAFPQTEMMEKRGREYTLNADPQPHEALFFCEGVCAWGDDSGQKIIRNLHKYHRMQLANVLHDWLSQVRHMSILEALIAGDSIKGLGVSFASKHLRMLEPDRFATLDGRLKDALGFALNPAGYQLFLHHLVDLHGQVMRLNPANPLFGTLGQIEVGIFHLAKQKMNVTANQAQPKQPRAKAVGRGRKATSSASVSSQEEDCTA